MRYILVKSAIFFRWAMSPFCVHRTSNVKKIHSKLWCLPTVLAPFFDHIHLEKFKTLTPLQTCVTMIYLFAEFSNNWLRCGWQKNPQIEQWKLLITKIALYTYRGPSRGLCAANWIRPAKQTMQKYFLLFNFFVNKIWREKNSFFYPIKLQKFFFRAVSRKIALNQRPTFK